MVRGHLTFRTSPSNGSEVGSLRATCRGSFSFRCSTSKLILFEIEVFYLIMSSLVPRLLVQPDRYTNGIVDEVLFFVLVPRLLVQPDRYTNGIADEVRFFVLAIFFSY